MVQALLSIIKVVQEGNDKQAMSELTPLIGPLINQMNSMLDVPQHDFYDEKIVDTATALLSIVYLMDDAQFYDYLNCENYDVADKSSSTKERLKAMLECFQRLIKFNTVVFPHIWLVVQVFNTEVAVKLLEWSNVYMGEFLEEKELQYQDALDGSSTLEYDDGDDNNRPNDLWDVFYDIGMRIVMMDLLS